MRRNLIIFLIVIIIIVVFTVQNSAPIPMRFWFWNTDLPASVWLTVAFVVGAVFGLFMSIPSRKKKNEKKAEESHSEPAKEETKFE